MNKVFKFISGLKNCHLPGLNSYVIRDRKSDAEGMVRMFHNTACHRMESLFIDDDYSLFPHNHRQDLTLSPVIGGIVNVYFEVLKNAHGKDIHEHILDKPALGGTGFEHHAKDTCLLPIWQITHVQPGESISLSTHQVHTVIAPVGSAWVVTEHALAGPRFESKFYCCKVGVRLNSSGLYLPMTRDELDEAEATVNVAELEAVCGS